MDKFLKEIGQEKLQKIGIPKNAEEIKEELNRLDDNFRRLNDKEIHKKIKKSVFKRLFKRK